MGNHPVNHIKMTLFILLAIDIKFFDEMFTIILSSITEHMNLPLFFLIITLVLTGSVVVAGCGNSILEAGEQCDDSNTLSGDGCDSNCQQ